MQQIERIVLGHFCHARREREIVRRKLEERVVRDRNLVIKDALIAAVQAEWLRIRDEMDFVAESRELNAELGSDNARSAVGWKGSDSYAHEPFLIFNFDSPLRLVSI